MNKTIAVDFDGTLCELTDNYPEIGEIKLKVFNKLMEEKEKGAKIILWTCREGEALLDAIDWCRRLGLIFDSVNSNLPENIEKWRTDPRKIGADEYWDDRAITC